MDPILLSILLAAVAYVQGFRNQKQLLLAINSDETKTKYQEYVAAGINDFQTTDKKVLRSIQQELIQKGEIDMAKRMNGVIDNEYKVSQESFTILDSYLESDKLYTAIVNNNFLPSE